MAKPLQRLLDVLILVLAFACAYLLRFEFRPGEADVRALLHQLPYVVLLQVIALYLVGVQSFIWRFIGMAEVKSFLKAAVFSSVPVIVLRLALPESYQVWRVPLSIIVFDTVLAFGGVLAARVLWRGVIESQRRQVLPAAGSDTPQKNILLIGAGPAGMSVARELKKSEQSDTKVVGFIDDEVRLRGMVLQGVPVLGTTADLARLVELHHIDHVIISIAEVSRVEIKRIIGVCEAVPVKARIIPAMSEIIAGRVNVSRIRDVRIEDLLGRAPVHLEEDELEHLLKGRVVMVTGAGGSIGSELTRQIARFSPSSLLLVERAEFALFNIERELREVWPDVPLVPLMADVGDTGRMRSIFQTYRPAVVLHAAAHKHVPLMEANPSEAVKNNVVGTQTVAQLSGEFGVEIFVLISTDKAVRPRSVMGASKRMAELVTQSMNGRYATKYVAVRFGNVIGSTGSVIPIFREQIRKGGPVTVTHPDMLRYFMTIPEASQLVLQAAAIGDGGEIFILDMGEPMRIADLAKDVIRLSGLKLTDIDIVYTGLRPGEKLFEELETQGETIAKTRHPKIFIGRIQAYPRETVELAIQQLNFLAQGNRDDEIRAHLNTLLPEARVSGSMEGAVRDAVRDGARQDATDVA